MHRVHSCGILVVALLAPAARVQAQSLVQIDRRAQIARADLSYDTPVSRPEEGLPIGNGRLGSLVWTTPSALKLQVNRVDVHAMDSTSFSFPRADSDYGYGCGFVDIHVAHAGDDVFTGSAFRQHLSLYDAVMTARGAGVRARAFAWPSGDVIAIEIDDQRAQPETIEIDLRMLRFESQYTSGKTAELARAHTVVVRTAGHTATSKLDIADGRIALTQQFREDAFYDSSAVVISVVGRPSRARYANQSTVQLSIPAARGLFTVLIGSAESRNPASNPSATAIEQIAAAERKGFAVLQQETAAWWSRFWAKGAVYLHSASGQADFVEANYDYFLYLMGSSSRGDFPPRFGGMLWQTDGDMSRWGSQYWWANTIAHYNNLAPANRLDLLDPLFKLYEGMLDAAARAAREQWGSQGIWIPETTFFNGPEPLPDDVAKDLRAMVLAEKPFEQRTAAFDAFAANKNRHNSRWNYRADGTWERGDYVFKSKGTGIFGHTSHILGVAARVGALGWQRYQMTGDLQWLRQHAYPFIRGAAEFYRNFPNLQKDAGGVYHINHTNSGESAWDSRDAPYEVSCMHMIFPLARRAAQVLGVDADLQGKWMDVKEHLVPPPARARCGTGSEIADDRPFGAFVYNGPGAIEPIGPEPELKQRFLGFTRLGSFIDPEGIGGPQIFRNRLRLREGPGALDAEHIAGLSMGVHTAMLNSRPESLAGDEPVSLFNAWPKDWDAAFTLLGRGDFLVSSAQQAGEVPLVEIVSQRGGTFRLANPWTAPVTLYRNGRKAEDLAGDALAFPTARGETVVVVPRGSRPQPVRLPSPQRPGDPLGWWRDARFGMFVHWGVYSALGNEFHGRRGGGYAEHIQRVLKIPIPQYREDVAGTFNPTRFDADDWIRRAKQAGMGYFVITAKHHDGFAMWPTTVNTYNIAQATPFKRDPMRELREACRKYGVKFGFYYSHAFDWGEADAPGNDWEYDNPGGDRLLGGADWWQTRPEFLPKARAYVDRKAIPQLRELVAAYQPDILWFDTPHKLPPAENQRILDAVRAMAPGVVVNGRLVRGAGDYESTADRPAEFSPHEGDWEGIPTTNESYGWNKFDRSHKPVSHFIRILAKAVARGGNVLMNIGPMGDGTFDPADIAILEGIGRWWTVNGESIRGAGRTPLPVQTWGESTRKGNRLYLHVFDWPADGTLVVGGLKARVTGAWLLSDAKRSPRAVSRLGPVDVGIAVPPAAPDGADSVIVLECDGVIDTDGVRLLQPSYAKETLRAFDAQLHGGLRFGPGKRTDDYVLGWSSMSDSITWRVRLAAAATYDVYASYDAPPASAGSTYAVAFGAQTLAGTVSSGTGQRVRLGTATLAPGAFDITVTATSITGAELLRLRGLTLERSSLVRGASPLGLPCTLSRAPLRRRAPFAWLTRSRAFATPSVLQRSARPTRPPAASVCETGSTPYPPASR